MADDEFGRLEKQSTVYAARIALLPLTPAERLMVAKVALTFHDIRAEGKAHLLIGTRVYFFATLCGVLAPVLTGLQGEESFGDDAQLVLRMISIALGAAALVLNTLDQVYQSRQRGAAYLAGGNQIKQLFENFCTLSGDLFDPTVAAATEGVPPTDWEAIKKVPLSALKAFVADLPAASPIVSLPGWGALDRGGAGGVGAPVPSAATVECAATSSTPTPQGPTHSGAQFRRFYAEFNRLQGLAREARFNGLDGGSASTEGD